MLYAEWSSLLVTLYLIAASLSNFLRSNLFLLPGV